MNSQPAEETLLKNTVVVASKVCRFGIVPLLKGLAEVPIHIVHPESGETIANICVYLAASVSKDDFRPSAVALTVSTTPANREKLIIADQRVVQCPDCFYWPHYLGTGKRPPKQPEWQWIEALPGRWTTVDFRDLTVVIKIAWCETATEEAVIESLGISVGAVII